MTKKKYAGMILAGGKGTRMGGKDKSGLMLHGKTFLKHLEEALNFLPKIYLSAGKSAVDTHEHLVVVKDVVADCGPLGGLYSVLEQADEEAVVVVPCDMPFFSEEMAKWLIEQHEAEPVLYLKQSLSGREFPLCGIYTKACLPRLEKMMEEKNYRVRELCRRAGGKVLTVPERMFSADRFLNVNTPEIYENLLDENQSAAEIPVFAFTAFSGTGKTTFLEKLIPLLREMGYRVGVIKHDAHAFEMDKEGKDTWRMGSAGAEVVAICNDHRAALLEHRPVSVEQLMSKIKDVDVILLEGYHAGAYPLITMARKATGKGFRVAPEQALAVVSDLPAQGDTPWFSLENPADLALFLREKMEDAKDL